MIQSSRVWFTRSALIVWICLLAVGPLSAGSPETPIITGTTFQLQSKVLGESRKLMVCLPDGYQRSTASYPVLYVLDGEGNYLLSAAVTEVLANSGRMPPVIVVGIPNTHRTRDFTPTSTKDAPASGGAPKFLQFLEQEVFPFIDGKYRTQKYRILFGHSLCGMFAVYTLLSAPDLFQACIAASPYVMYGDNHVVKLAAGKISQPLSGHRLLYMTVGDEPAYMDALGQLTGLLKEKAPASLEWRLDKMPGEDHGSVRLKTLYQGLEILFASVRLPADLTALGMEGLAKHYDDYRAKFGYAVEIPERVINALGYQLIAQKKAAEAIAVLRENVKRFPGSPNVYDSLGEALEAAGQTEEAAAQYRQAVELGKKSKDPNSAIFQQHLDRVTKK